MIIRKAKCNQCNWQGNEDNLEYDIVETCMGNDKIEICPQCRSMEVYIFYPDEKFNKVTKPTE
jgi:NAD-dependent SIR2 family protein deacetylase